MNNLFEMNKQFENIFNQILSALRDDDDEYLKRIFTQIPDFFRHCATDKNLLIEAYRYRAIKCFGFMVDNVECENRKQQFKWIEKLALHQHQKINKPLSSDDSKSLDLLAVFRTSKEFINALHKRLCDNSVHREHVTLYRAFLLTNDINPYDMLSRTENCSERAILMNLIVG
ncbi:hypothetical protein [Alteromonas stellipolaris]|uniref:hypothetical protein n=1 Tax=Alteromonas stellipolaris TaxID=233316 RepID=UPI0024956E54|nr:hypothetical protein [Alteromonas stellipolaris]